MDHTIIDNLQEQLLEQEMNYYNLIILKIIFVIIFIMSIFVLFLIIYYF